MANLMPQAPKYQPGTRVSEYRLEEPVGIGSFGEVWRARHHIWESEQVAIKLPTQPDYVRYLQREGVVVHGLRHPNIVRVLGLDPYADIPYLVMELVSGPSLRDVINQHKQGLPGPTVHTVLEGMLRALVVAHEANVLHRDLKPGNILLQLEKRPLAELRVDDVKVSDFGLSFADSTGSRSVLDSASLGGQEHQVGTLAYMAPETREGAGPPDPRSDLYSVGVVLFEMLTGERPAGAELPSALRTDTAPGLDEIYRRLYARIDRRYPSARAALADLELLRGPQGAHAVPGALPPIPASREERRCVRCKAYTSPEDQFCTVCGAQLVSQVRRCGQCNAFPAPDDRYCIYCGAALPAMG